MSQVTVNGNTYSSAGESANDMRSGGHRTHLLPMLADAVTDLAAKVVAAQGQVTLAEAQADLATTNGAAQVVLAAAQVVLAEAEAEAAAASAGAAASSASAASTSAGNAATSESNAAASAASAAAIANAFIGTSATSWTPVVESKAFTTQAGELYTAGVYVTVVSAAVPTAYGFGQVISYTGTTLTVDVQLVGGTGAHTDWNISLSGVRGATGAQGPAGATFTGGSLTSAINLARANVASHATTGAIWAAAGNQINWTGTATTTAFPNAPQAGASRTLICAGACSFTAGANMLIDGVASGSTVVCAANDKVIVEAVSTTQFKLSRVKYDGTAQVSAGGSSVVRSARTSNTILAEADRGTLIDITSGTFSQTFTAAATLASGWFCYIRNSGTGDVTLEPDGAELIDGLTNFVMYGGETRLMQCTGTAFTSVVLSPFYRAFTVTGTFTKPPGYSVFEGLLWAGGGGGGKSNSANIPGGGGGGACVPFRFPASSVGATETVTIGAGGAGSAVAGSGTVGGNSTFGSLVGSYGGGAGGGESGVERQGGGGGGALSAGADGLAAAAVAIGGHPVTTSDSTQSKLACGQFGGGNAFAATSNKSFYGGAGGGGGNTTPGGTSTYGGGGGAGAPAGDTTNGGGSSIFGGAGGHGRGTISGVDGSAPAGGGGGTRTGTKGGDGARGEARIWGIA